jgi:phosphoglycolate phosphatase-like HAD superfamily hydrolase
MEPTRIRVVFFDLDGTLFDHYHSLRLATSAIQTKYTGLAGENLEELIDQYNIALQQAYNDYLDKVITYEEADVRKIHLFFAALGLPEPSLNEVREFHDAYKAVYRANRRATQEASRLWLGFVNMDTALPSSPTGKSKTRQPRPRLLVYCI